MTYYSASTYEMTSFQYWVLHHDVASALIQRNFGLVYVVWHFLSSNLFIKQVFVINLILLFSFSLHFSYMMVKFYREWNLVTSTFLQIQLFIHLVVNLDLQTWGKGVCVKYLAITDATIFAASWDSTTHWQVSESIRGHGRQHIHSRLRKRR